MTDPRTDTPRVPGPSQATTPPVRPVRRRSRIGLYAPFVLLALLAVLWTGGWFVLRHRAVGEIDAFFAREAAAGRTWACPGRSVTGYPFRLELRCDGVSFARSDLSWQVGPVVALAQVYDPGHVIVQARGPLRLTEGTATLNADWRELDASFHATLSGFQRLSLVVEEPKGTVDGVVIGTAGPGAAAPTPIAFAARHFEAHARPTPGRFETEGAIDVSARLGQATLPVLDPMLGGNEPADVGLDATLNRARGFGAGPLPTELERWRAAGGTLDLTQFSLAKGPRRLQARGTLALDEGHRLAGQAQIRAAGVEAMVSAIMGERLGTERGALIGNLVGQLLTGLARPRDPAPAQAQPDATAGDPSLKPLPPLRLADGRLFLGPLAIPNVSLVPLY